MINMINPWSLALCVTVKMWECMKFGSPEISSHTHRKQKASLLSVSGLFQLPSIIVPVKWIANELIFLKLDLLFINFLVCSLWGWEHSPRFWLKFPTGQCVEREMLKKKLKLILLMVSITSLHPPIWSWKQCKCKTSDSQSLCSQRCWFWIKHSLSGSFPDCFQLTLLHCSRPKSNSI